MGSNLVGNKSKVFKIFTKVLNKNKQFLNETISNCLWFLLITINITLWRNNIFLQWSMKSINKNLTFVDCFKV